MKLIIDISKNEYNDIVEQVKKCDYPDMGLGKIISNGRPVSDITDEQISDAFQIAIANYWEEKSKHLTPPPTAMVANGKHFVCPLDYPTEDDPYPICPVSEAKWIPVSERLPDYSDWYVVTIEVMCHRFMAIVAFDAKYKNWGCGGVVAWIDAKPYTGGEHNEENKKI